jgi:hypothetical protein
MMKYVALQTSSALLQPHRWSWARQPIAFFQQATIELAARCQARATVEAG